LPIHYFPVILQSFYQHLLQVTNSTLKKQINNASGEDDGRVLVVLVIVMMVITALTLHTCGTAQLGNKGR